MSSDTTPPTAPPSSGVKSVLKIAVPLAVMFGVVFGVVFLSQNAPKPEEEVKGAKSEDTSGTQPLRFFTDTRQWDQPKLIDREQTDLALRDAYRDFPMLAPSARAAPDPFQPWNYQLANRLFQGVYETDPNTRRGAQFWFENRNKESVTLQLKYVSCTQCSSGRLAVIPPDVTKNLLQHSAVAALPLGAFNGYGVLMSQPFAQLTQLQWTSYEFKDLPTPGAAVFKVPGAPGGDKWAEQWGILELGFSVRRGPTDPQEPITAAFAAVVDGTTRTSLHQFGIAFSVAHAFEVWPESINLGRVDELATDTTHDLIAFSSTRGPGSEFQDLTLTKSDFLPKGPNGSRDDVGFVEVTKIERVPEKDLVDLESRLSVDRNRPARVRSAYRVTLTVHPKVGGKRMDIGAIDRAVAVTSVGVQTVQTVRITGSVRGAVRLDKDRGDITLNEFKGRDGTKQEFDLFTDRLEIELGLLKSESTPDIYVYDLIPQPDRDNQRHYKLRITVPAGVQYGSKSGEVVLEVKGPNPQRVRFPVRGKGNL